MAYLAGVEHDIFLSYAHGNPVLREWSLRVEGLLRDSLGILLGDRDNLLSIFTDKDALQGNDFLTPQLKTAVESSAALVIILTRHYVKSPWCQGEVKWFTAIAKNVAEGIFVIRAQPVLAADWPAPLKQNGEPILGYTFCDDREDALPYGILEQQTDKLGQAVVQLSQALFQFLRRRNEAASVSPPAPPSAAPGGVRPRVFVGFTTEDLEPDRSALAAQLSAGGELDVAAPAAPEEVDKIHALIAAAAEDSVGLVQLCGRASGRWARSADGYIADQIRQFEGKRRSTWLVLGSGLELAKLPASPYADFLKARDKRFHPAPTATEIRDALTAAAPADAPFACTLFVQSRKSYELAERQLRLKINDIRAKQLIDAVLLPIPPIYTIQEAGQLAALLQQRSQRAADIQAGLLILTDEPALLGEDLLEYRRDTGVGTARWPAAIVDASSASTVTEVDLGYPVFRLGDPAFSANLVQWLRGSVGTGGTGRGTGP
jgi:TIR domain